MKILEIDLTSMRTFKHVNYKVPRGLSLLTGPNGSGKSTLLGIGAAWALWGETPGRSQDYLVRHGEREMVGKILIESNSRVYSIERRFVLAKGGKGGVTKLTFSQLSPPLSESDAVDSGGWKDLTGSINKETQADINAICGTYEVWAMTAYVGQREGAGQFLQANAYERKGILREIIAGAGNWDEWEGVAKTHAAKCGTAINRIEGALPAIEEFIEANSWAKLQMEGFTIQVAARTQEIKTLNLNLEDLQDENDEVDKVIAENDRRAHALLANSNDLGIANAKHNGLEDQRAALTNLVTNLPALDEERRIWLTETDTWDDRNTEYHRNVGKYDMEHARWGEKITTLREMLDYYQLMRDVHDRWALNIKAIDAELDASPPVTHCPTCAQKLETDEAAMRANESREKLAEERHSSAGVLLKLNELVDASEIQETIDQYKLEQPVAPVSPGTRPVFESETEWNSAKSAENDIAAVDAEIKTRSEQVKTLEDAREKLPTPDTYDSEEHATRTLAIIHINSDILQAETDKAERQRKLTEAETLLAEAEKQKGKLVELRAQLTAEKTNLHQWEVTAQMCGTNGIRQLIIDQSLGAMESASNRWLQIIAPGFEIAFSTQTETDRETFDEGIIMPSGAIQPWSELSGAQSVAVALAVRMGLAELGGAAQGIHYGTLYLDEADSWLTGDYQQQFMDMLNRVADTGIDVVAITHIESVQDMVDQQTRVVPIDSETSEVRS